MMPDTPDALMSEAEVYERYGKVLVNRELRLARQRGQIGYYDLRAGPHYSVAQVMQYLASMERKPCPTNSPLNDNADVEELTDSSSLADSGLAASKGAQKSSGTGTNQPRRLDARTEELAASRLERLT